MGDWNLMKLGFRGGVWQGRLSARSAGNAAPGIEVQVAGAAVPGVELQPDGPGAWVLSVPVPAEALGDGIATFLLVEQPGGAAVAQFAIATGEPADDDLRAEVALLRAELDMIKRHFRRVARGD
ncbi:MAG: hypothetical protein IT562_12600 [Alphaproteobacteria bacterium]|nr:hypothetical protein [Alphaproteobacteria bacterium]